ncbi:hypothetical protein GGQ84_001352 [Desulfitispora alkaliphila]
MKKKIIGYVGTALIALSAIGGVAIAGGLDNS